MDSLVPFIFIMFHFNKCVWGFSSDWEIVSLPSSSSSDSNLFIFTKKMFLHQGSNLGPCLSQTDSFINVLFYWKLGFLIPNLLIVQILQLLFKYCSIWLRIFHSKNLERKCSHSKNTFHNEITFIRSRSIFDKFQRRFNINGKNSVY